MAEESEKMIDRVAKAIWEAQRKQEIKRLENFKCDHMIFETAGRLLQTASEREAIIMVFSLISRCIDAAVGFHLSSPPGRTKRSFSTTWDRWRPMRPG